MATYRNVIDHTPMLRQSKVNDHHNTVDTVVLQIPTTAAAA